MVSLAAEAFGGQLYRPEISVFRLPLYEANAPRNIGKMAGLHRLAGSACKIVYAPFTRTWLVHAVREISSMIYRVIKP
jgi:hypothetical protein